MPWSFKGAEAPRFQDSRHMEVVRLWALRTGRLCPAGNIPGTHFCSRLSRPQGHNTAGRIMSFLNIMLFALLEELVCFIFIYFWEWIDRCFIFNFGLGLSTWAGSGWDLFGVLHFVGFSSFVGWYFFVYNSLGSLRLFSLCGNNSLVGGLYYVCIVYAFSVKLPMFMVHLLLAHVEAHISGSLILAWCVWSSSCFSCVV